MSRVQIGKGYRKVGNKWRVQIRIDGKKVHFGYYDTEDEAKVASKKAFQYRKKLYDDRYGL